MSLFFKSAILILKKRKKTTFCFISKQARSYEVSFISALWMVFSESWKRLHPNWYAHDTNLQEKPEIRHQNKEKQSEKH